MSISRSLDWQDYVDDDDLVELPNYIYTVVLHLMKYTLDLGTIFADADDDPRLRSFRSRVKNEFKERWFDIAEMLEYMELIVPCGCSFDDYCRQCFSGDTRYITKDGIKTFAETVGTVQQVLTNDTKDRRSGHWEKAEIKSYGKQPLMKVTVGRNGVKKDIYATRYHEWFVRCAEPGQRHGFTNHRKEFTKDLKPNHPLAFLYPQNLIYDIMPSNEGILHGIVFGDGTKNTTQSTKCDLWGEKNAQLLNYFPVDAPRKDIETQYGETGIKVSCLPGYFKELPSFANSYEYLLGFLMGYFAADGNCSGTPSLDCASYDTIQTVRDLCTVLGIDTFGIRSHYRKGCYGRGAIHNFMIDNYGECTLEEPSLLYSLGFVRSDLPLSFFLIKEHQDNFIRSYPKYERLGWVVHNIEETDIEEEVYCAEVPGTESFALEDNIWVHNCQGARYLLNRAFSSDIVHEISTVVVDDEDSDLAARMQQQLAELLSEQYGENHD